MIISYEAYVIYQFFSLLTAFIEESQPVPLETLMAEKEESKLPIPLCLINMKPSIYALIVIKQCILQYVVIKPLMSILAVVLNSMGVYEEGNFRPWFGYVYVTAITFASVTISMYCLVLFYFLMEEDLKPHKPIAKFLCVKAILFFSFWQGVIIAVFSYFNLIPNSVGDWTQENISRGFQDFIICIEMAILAIAHGYVFSADEYGEINLWESTSAKVVVAQPAKNFAKHVINQKDVVTDIKNVYSPSKVSDAKLKHKHVKQQYREKQIGAMKLDVELEMDPSPLIDGNDVVLPEIHMTIDSVSIQETYTPPINLPPDDSEQNLHPDSE